MLVYTSLHEGGGAFGINDGRRTSDSLELMWLFVLDYECIIKRCVVYEIYRQWMIDRKSDKWLAR